MSRKKSLWLTLFIYILVIFIGYLFFKVMNDSFSLLVTTLLANIVMTTIIFIGSMRYSNSSLYDPYWSVIPIFIVLLWMVELNKLTISDWIIFIGVSVWSIRLTTNWMRDFKGYSHEDFRYVDFRNKFGKLYWLVSYTGIHMFPTLIVYVSLYPIYYLWTNSVLMSSYIFIGVVIMIVGTYISFVADGQLRRHKKSKKSTSIYTGLWKYSRHPNYFGEVTFWFGVAIVSIAVDVNIVPFLGFIGMLALFNLYSVPKMEEKLLTNKKDYQFVIENVPRFFINPLNEVPVFEEDVQNKST